MTRLCRRPGCGQTVLTWLHPHYCSMSCRDQVHRGIPATLTPRVAAVAEPVPLPRRTPRPVPAPRPTVEVDPGWLERVRDLLRARR